MSATKLNEQLNAADETAPQAADLANLATAPASDDAAQPSVTQQAQPDRVADTAGNARRRPAKAGSPSRCVAGGAV